MSYVSGLGFGVGPGVFEGGDGGEALVEECLVFFYVCCDEVVVDGDVDVGEFGGVFPGVGVEGVEEGDEYFLGVDEVVVCWLFGFEGVEGSFDVEGESFEE